MSAKRFVVKWLERACTWTHPVTHHRPWLWLPIRAGWCPLARLSYSLEERWETGAWKTTTEAS